MDKLQLEEETKSFASDDTINDSDNESSLSDSDDEQPQEYLYRARKGDKKKKIRVNYVTREEKEFFMACIEIGIRKITKKEFRKWLRIKTTLEFIMI